MLSAGHDLKVNAQTRAQACHQKQSFQAQICLHGARNCVEAAEALGNSALGDCQKQNDHLAGLQNPERALPLRKLSDLKESDQQGATIPHQKQIFLRQTANSEVLDRLQLGGSVPQLVLVSSLLVGCAFARL
jgi:hypothetical protein